MRGVQLMPSAESDCVGAQNRWVNRFGRLRVIGRRLCPAQMSPERHGAVFAWGAVGVSRTARRCRIKFTDRRVARLGAYSDGGA